MTSTTEKKPSLGWGVFHATCTSLSPLLLNPMTEDTLDILTFGSARKGARDTTRSIRDIATDKLILGPNDEFGIPTNYLFAALVEAGRHVIFDKKTKVSTRESSLVPVFLRIVPEIVREDGEGFIPFLDQEAASAWVANRKRGVLSNGASKTAVPIIRPLFQKWDFAVTIEVDQDYIDISKVDQLLKAAGRIAGIGDFRPSRRGPYGQFDVKEFVAVEQAVRHAA